MNTMEWMVEFTTDFYGEDANNLAGPYATEAEAQAIKVKLSKERRDFIRASVYSRKKWDIHYSPKTTTLAELLP